MLPIPTLRPLGVYSAPRLKYQPCHSARHGHHRPDPLGLRQHPVLVFRDQGLGANELAAFGCAGIVGGMPTLEVNKCFGIAIRA